MLHNTASAAHLNICPFTLKKNGFGYCFICLCIVWDIHLCATYEYSIIAYYRILLPSTDPIHNSLVIVKDLFLTFSHVHKKIQLDRIHVTTDWTVQGWLALWNVLKCERHLATLYKINHTSDFHTLTESKSHFTHLCFNDRISWPVLSAFVLSEEESSALVWKRGQWFYETARVTSAATGRSLRLNVLSIWSSWGTLGTKHLHSHLNCVPAIQLEEIRLSLVAERMYIC